MGFSTAFGAAFFYRVALPGIVVAILVQPLVSEVPAALGLETYFPQGPITVLGAVALVAGLIFAGTSRSIYYFCEGFIWPRSGRTLGVWWQKRKIRKLADRQGQLYEMGENRSPTEEDESRIVADSLRDYPIHIDTRAGERWYFADRPTHLGNIIASYELYPHSRYGVDGEAFWHHFRLLAPEGAAKDLDASEAVADGMILTSFAAALGAALNGTTLVLMFVGSKLPLLPPAPITTGQLALLTGIGVSMSLIFLRLGKASHREYGRVVRAMVDLTYVELIKRLKADFPTEEEREAIQKRRERLETLSGATAETVWKEKLGPS